jgi:hypothetical protein
MEISSNDQALQALADLTAYLTGMPAKPAGPIMITGLVTALIPVKGMMGMLTVAYEAHFRDDSGAKSSYVLAPIGASKTDPSTLPVSTLDSEVRVRVEIKPPSVPVNYSLLNTWFNA